MLMADLPDWAKVCTNIIAKDIGMLFMEGRASPKDIRCPVHVDIGIISDARSGGIQIFVQTLAGTTIAIEAKASDFNETIEASIQKKGRNHSWPPTVDFRKKAVGNGTHVGGLRHPQRLYVTVCGPPARKDARGRHMGC